MYNNLNHPQNGSAEGVFETIDLSIYNDDLAMEYVTLDELTNSNQK